MYPNPTSDYVNFNGLTSTNSIKIIDIYGKSIIHRELKNNKAYVGDLNSGVYLILIDNLYQKLIINNK